MLETKSKTINGVSFSVTPFFVMESLKLKRLLFATFGPALGNALGALDRLPTEGQNIEEMKLDGAALSSAMETLFTNLSEETFLELIKRLFANTTAQATVDGKSIIMPLGGGDFDNGMNIVFSGRTFTIYPALLWVLEVNFPDFFGQAGALFGSLRKIRSSKQAKGDTANVLNVSGT